MMHSSSLISPALSPAMNAWLDDLDQSWLPGPVGLPAHDEALAAVVTTGRRRWFRRSAYKSNSRG